MSGTIEGGRKAAQKNKLRHGPDFYARIGAKGGRNGNTGGFAANRDLARAAGRKGGLVSRRRKTAVAPSLKQSDLELAA
jgi:uncharacterized protein